MAPKKSANGFMLFTFDWKAKHGKHMSMREATTEAGRAWDKMSQQQRGPYNEKAKQDRICTRDHGEKLTCTGIPISHVEKEKIDSENRERQMKRFIETTVRNDMKTDELESRSYYFIMVNYFTKNLRGGVYVPAEISVAEYSLKYGVSRKLHSYINPGVTIYGHQYEAQHYSDTTHKLPLPPNAMGDTNLGRIYNDVLDFVRVADTGDYPPVFTLRDNIPVVDSVLNFLKSDISASSIDLRIYSIQYLFYIMKEATCEMGELDKPKSAYITDAYFERDFFEYQTGIACQYHEDCDRTKYCTQSFVTRWGFMFSDYMCRDIAISLIPGRHVPQSTNLAAIVNPPSSVCGGGGVDGEDDNKSIYSSFTETSAYTNALSEHKIYYDDPRQEAATVQRTPPRTNDNISTYTEEFPALGGSGRRTRIVTTGPVRILNCNEELDLSYIEHHRDNRVNPWASRSQQRVPRELDSSHFSIDFSASNTMRDDCASTITSASGLSLGRGRGQFYR